MKGLQFSASTWKCIEEPFIELPMLGRAICKVEGEGHGEFGRRMSQRRTAETDHCSRKGVPTSGYQPKVATETKQSEFEKGRWRSMGLGNPDLSGEMGT